MPLPKRRLAELSAGEKRQRAPRHPVTLPPPGSHEDKGPHIPIADQPSAEAVALRTAVRATQAGTETFVAPVPPFGGADDFGSAPRGTALSQSTLRVMLDEMLACLLRHGLTRILVVNGLGGYGH
jgi:creatinine amidohydrolase